MVQFLLSYFNGKGIIGESRIFIFFNLLKSDQGVCYNVRVQSIEKHIDRNLITILLFQNFAFICWTELYHVNIFYSPDCSVRYYLLNRKEIFLTVR